MSLRNVRLDFSKIKSLKGEFEAEGLSRDALAAEAALAARHDLPYLVKIGGCEAKSDMHFMMLQGIRDIVAPMIESPFAMAKYQEMLPEGAFDKVGVTIETIDAVRRIDEILDAGSKLTEVTVGRTDLTASFNGSSVESEETISMTKTVVRAARKRGIGTTMGGSVSVRTLELLRRDGELRELLDCVETRKCIMSVPEFVDGNALETAFAVECALLDHLSKHHGFIANSAASRVEQLRKRS